MKPEIFTQDFTPEMLPELTRACLEEDKHPLPIGPTHVFRRDGRIVGAASVFSPVADFWAHSTALHARESADLISRAKQLASSIQPHYCVLCSSTSPFAPHMSRFGFNRLGSCEVWEMQP